MMTRRVFLPLPFAIGACSTKRPANVVRIAASASNPVLSLAVSLGYFAEQGLEVTLEELRSNSKTLEAVAGGSVEVAYSGYDQVLQAAGAGRSVQSFFVVFTRPIQVLAVTPPIRTAADLKGRMVGVASLGSTSQMLLSRLLLLQGMSPADVSPVAIGNGPSAVAAVETGKVPAAMVSNLVFEILRDKVPGVGSLLDTRTAEGTKQVYGIPLIAAQVLVANPRWLDEQPGTARRIVLAAAKASRWIHDNPFEEVYAKLPEGYRTPDSGAARRALRQAIPNISRDGRVPDGSPEAVRDFLLRAADPSLQVDLTKTYTNEYLEANS